MNIYENERMSSVSYDSILDVINTKCTSSSLKNIEMNRGFINYIGSSGWYGKYNSSKELMNAALLGDRTLYNENLKIKISKLKSESMLNTAEQTIKTIKRKIEYSSIGGEIDIHKVYQGNLETAWRGTRRIEVASKFHLVTLLIDYVGSAKENAGDSLWRSAVAVKIYSELLSAGKAVRILVGSVSKNSFIGSTKLTSTSIGIKRYNETLSLERLSVMSNLGFFRCAGFIAKTMHDETLNSSLGISLSLSQENLPIDIQREKEMGHTKFVIVGRSNTLKSAIADLEKCYKQMEDFTK